ncbi:MAG: MMPL family transporter [Sulfobacillus benefaciens]|uniref:MMPL family transporter n=1 Tax=Sulfobacillus benefaciens TaxID=453960 RepID=A0A2T2X3Q5_9FIRM|nr:MAG: MMPL family transporter [Sulfobacillus benefaciens]
MLTARILKYPKIFLLGWLVIIAIFLPFAVHVTHGLSSYGFDNPRSRVVWADNQASNVASVSQQPPELVTGLSWSRATALAAQNHIPQQWLHRLSVKQFVLVIPASQQNVVTTPPDLKLLRQFQANGGTLKPASQLQVANRVISDTKATLGKSSLVAFPLLVILLLTVFGSAAAAVLPLIVALAGSILSLGIVDLLEHGMTLSIYLTVSFLALGVGVDYALFISSRFRQELSRGETVAQAVAVSMARAGRSVVFSGLAVSLAVLTLVFGGNDYWRGLAVGGAVAVLADLLATHTLLPAILTIMGHRVEWGRISFRHSHQGWAKISSFVSRYPYPAIVLGLVVLLIPGYFGMHLQMSTPANLSVMLPTTDPLRESVAIQQNVDGKGSLAPLSVVLQYHSTIAQMATWQNVATVTEHLRNLPDVASVASPSLFGLSPTQLATVIKSPMLMPAKLKPLLNGFISAKHSHLVVLYVVSRSGPDARRTENLVQAIKRDMPRWVPHGTQWGVGGLVPLLASFNHLTARRLPWIIGAVALVAFTVLLLATGSVFQSLLGVVFDGIVALATAGVLVETVQTGHLGLQALQPESAITPLIFVLLFGLSMDYEVILLHRIQELARSGAHNIVEACQKGVEITGGMITGAGMIMVAVFVALFVSPLEIMKTLAIGMTAAILLDTWVVRTLMVPASVAILDRFAFWPRMMPPPAKASAK